MRRRVTSRFRPCLLLGPALFALCYQTTTAGATVPKPAAFSPAVVICGVDGIVHTIDAQSGHLRGIFASGPPLVSSSGSGGSSGYVTNQEGNLDDLSSISSKNSGDGDSRGIYFLSLGEAAGEADGDDHDGGSGGQHIVPDLDGNLYSLLPPLPSGQSLGLWLKRLPISAADFINAPTLRCAKEGRCSIIMGEKRSRVFRLDPTTGQVIWLRDSSSENQGFTAADSSLLYSFDDPSAKESSAGGGRDEATSMAAAVVMLQREDYVLRSVDTQTGKELWNVTVGRFSTLDFGEDMEQVNSDSDVLASDEGIYTIDGEGTPELPPRKFGSFYHDRGGNDATKQSDLYGNRGSIEVVPPLPSIAVGEDGTSVVAIDTKTGKRLWQRQIGGVITAVYGIGGIAGKWIPLNVIDDFGFARAFDEAQLEQRLILGDGSQVDGKDEDMLLLPSSDPSALNLIDGLTSSGYSPSTSSIALISSFTDVGTVGTPRNQHIGRVMKHSDTLFITSVSRSLFSVVNGDMCEKNEAEKRDAVDAGNDVKPIREEVDINDFESMSPLLQQSGLLPPDATSEEQKMYAAVYSLMLEAQKTQSRRPAKGLFLSWSVVAIMACAIVGIMFGVRLGYKRQKMKWEKQNTPVSPQEMMSSEGSQDSQALSGHITPVLPLVLDEESASPTTALQVSGTRESKASPLVTSTEPPRCPGKTFISHSTSMPALPSSDSNSFSQGESLLLVGNDSSSFSQPPLALKAVLDKTAPTTAPTSSATQTKSAEQRATSLSLKETNTNHGVGNLDGVPLIRYARYTSEFKELSALGRGGFGTVFKCENTLDGRFYAIKKIRIKTQLGRRERLHRVLREVKILALLDHPHIVRYYTAWLEIGEGSSASDAEAFSDLTTACSSELRSCLESSWPHSVGLGQFSRPSINGKMPSIGRKLISRKTNPLGWNSFLDSPSLFEVSEEANSTQRQALPNQTSEDDLGFHWDRSSSSLSLAKHSSAIGSRSSLPSCDEEEDVEDDSDDKSGSSSSSCSGLSLSDVDETEAEFSLANMTEMPTKATLNGGANDQKNNTVIQGKDQLRQGVASDNSIQRHTLYIQMQLCNKQTLADFLADPEARKNPDASTTGGIDSATAASSPKGIIGGVNLPHALRLFIQIARGVKHVHEQGLIHRDLKPMNCFIDEFGFVKIGDFGLSRESSDIGVDDLEEGDGGKKDDPSGGVARRVSLGGGEDNTVGVGTRAYASPEQLAGSAYDASTDVYSLGIILIELCYPMYTGMERHVVFRNLRALKFPCQWTTTVARTFPPLHELLVEMLSPRPRDRPTSDAVERRADNLLGEYTCALHGLDFSMYQKLRQLDRANGAKQQSNASKHGKQRLRSCSVGRDHDTQKKIAVDEDAIGMRANEVK